MSNKDAAKADPSARFFAVAMSVRLQAIQIAVLYPEQSHSALKPPIPVAWRRQASTTSSKLRRLLCTSLSFHNIGQSRRIPALFILGILGGLCELLDNGLEPNTPPCRPCSGPLRTRTQECLMPKVIARQNLATFLNPPPLTVQTFVAFLANNTHRSASSFRAEESINQDSSFKSWFITYAPQNILSLQVAISFELQECHLKVQTSTVHILMCSSCSQQQIILAFLEESLARI